VVQWPLWCSRVCCSVMPLCGGLVVDLQHGFKAMFCWMDENVSDFRSNQSGSWNCTKAKIKNVSEVNGCEVSIFLPYGSEMIK
jgi:hypothetical protein